MVKEFVVIDADPKGLEIDSLRKKDDMYEVRFAGYSKTYKYKESNVKVYSKWREYDPDSCIVEEDGEVLDNITKIRQYFSTESDDEVSECWRIWFDDDEDFVDYYNDDDLCVTPNVLDYLTEVVSVKAKIERKVYSTIESLYEDINEFYEEDDLSEPAKCFLEGKNKKTWTANTDKLILPYSCNDSQLTAIERVFHSCISVIVGPPGTGKTQTILNIIANIVYKGKTVLVVSNSDNAVANIKERLDADGFGFLVANLGNYEKRNEFIENRDKIPSDISQWSKQGGSKKEAYENLGKLKAYYAYKQAIQRCKNQISAILRKKENSSSPHNDEHNEILDSLTKKIKSLEERLKDFDGIEQDLLDTSIELFRKKLGKKFDGKELKKLSVNKKNEFSFDKLIERYPIVLSTAASVINSFKEYPEFDYVVIDEASQVPIETGFLSLVSAKNAVLVGDDKQLGHIVTDEQKERLNKWFHKWFIPDGYNVVKSSFLDSICSQIEGISITMLQEHYRCAPQIIGFSNNEFYNGKLVVMTEDSNDGTSPFRIISTVKGNLGRKRLNQRQVEIIKKEILPEIKEKHPDWTIGIITPYRDQRDAAIDILKQEIDDTTIEISTIHGFQGKEKDVIILSTVDNQLKKDSFINDSRIMNVALTRAKKQFIMIINDSAVYKVEGILQSFVGHILKHSSMEHSEIESIFDRLYNKEEMMKYLSEHEFDKTFKYDSEKIAKITIDEVLSSLKLNDKVDVEHEIKLKKVVSKDVKLTKEEKDFIKHGASLDFLLRNKKGAPILAIEVDGYAFHKPGSYQKEVRDPKKDSILKKNHIRLLRLTTLGSEEEKQITNALKEVLKM